MAQEMAKQICDHCGVAYTTQGGNSVVHCTQCFACEQYKPFSAMYGRVGGKGYCCRECETLERWSARLVFDVVLNLPCVIDVGA